MIKAISTYLEAVCWAVTAFWEAICSLFHYLRNKAGVDYDDLDIGDWVYVASEEELATYAAMQKEMLGK